MAGGDLLLSGRVRPDGMLSLPEPDHSFPGAPPLPGDPLTEIRDLAGQVSAAGVRRIEGRIVVDASLFREGQESIATGDTMITVSPMMVNDHIVHAVVTPRSGAGAPGAVLTNPATAYVRFANFRVRTASTSASSGAP